MENLKVKIICGFDKEKEFTINADEAHRAYYLFNHPEERGTFSNGVAIIGKYIHSIVPDYHATMGWTIGYELKNEDYAELSAKGIDRQIRDLLSDAKSVAKTIDETGNKKLLDWTLTKLMSLPSPAGEPKYGLTRSMGETGR